MTLLNYRRRSWLNFSRRTGLSLIARTCEQKAAIFAESIQPISTREPPNGENNAQIKRYFPMAYSRSVQHHGLRHKVPRTLIWAIMREEPGLPLSRFIRRCARVDATYAWDSKGYGAG